VEKRLVYPGDPVGVAEEFVPGAGTYEEDGQVFAATVGYLTLDTSDFVARVQSLVHAPAVVKSGDTVIGVVNGTRSSMAIVAVVALADQPNRQVGGDRNGTLHVSKASEAYVENMEDVFRVRDVLRAKVLETDPAIQLTTKGPHLGVLKAYCPRCGIAMTRKGKARAEEQDRRRAANAVVCPECDWKDTKKLADDFGEGNVI
jgi:exosome complex component CSL4